MLCTRHDICFAVNLLSRYQNENNPSGSFSEREMEDRERSSRVENPSESSGERERDGRPLRIFQWRPEWIFWRERDGRPLRIFQKRRPRQIFWRKIKGEDPEDFQARTYQDWDGSGSKTQLLLEVDLFGRGLERRWDFSSNESPRENEPIDLPSLPSVALGKGSIFLDFSSAFLLAWTPLALSNLFIFRSMGERKGPLGTLYKCERGYGESPVEWEKTHAQRVALLTALVLGVSHSAATTMYFRRVLKKVKMSISATKFW